MIAAFPAPDDDSNGTLGTAAAQGLASLVAYHRRCPALFDGNPDAIVLFGLDGTLMFENHATVALFGPIAKERIGERLGALLTPDRRPWAREAFRRAGSGETVARETTLLRADGTSVALSATLLPAVADGTIVGVYAIVRDLSAERESQAAISRRLQELSSLFLHHPDSVMSLDLRGRCTSANAACEALLEHSSDEIIGHPYASFIAPRSLTLAASIFMRAAAGEAVFETIVVVAKDGREKEAEGMAVPIVVDGKVVGVYAIGRDVTGRRRLEAAVREQGDRIRELYLVASSTGQSADAQIRAALEVGVNRLQCDGAAISRIEGGSATTLHTFGYAVHVEGHARPLETSLLRFLRDTDETLAIDDLRQPPWVDDASQCAHQMSAFIGAPLFVAGESFGTLDFINVRRRSAPFTESDRDFVRLIGALVASAIERGEQRRRLDNLAFFDALTGLPNRVLLNDRLEEAIVIARRSAGRFAVHFLDLDGFKEINDVHGHGRGDEVLRAVARRLERVVPIGSTVARIGGDEFVVVQPLIGSVDDAMRLAVAVRSAIAEPFALEGREHALSASVGVALYPDDAVDPATLLSRADVALYRVKSDGRDGVAISGRPPS